MPQDASVLLGRLILARNRYLSALRDLGLRRMIFPIDGDSFDPLRRTNEYEEWSRTASAKERDLAHSLSWGVVIMKKAFDAAMLDDPWKTALILSLWCASPAGIKLGMAGRASTEAGKSRRAYSPVLDDLIKPSLAFADGQSTAEEIFYSLFDDLPRHRDGFDFRREEDVLHVEEADSGRPVTTVTLKSFRNRVSRLRRSS